MAGTFQCDPQAAAHISADLAGIRTEMKSMNRTFSDFAGATGSRRVEEALRRFYSESSDSRKSMDALLERAAGLRAGLAEGTMAADQSLADALPQPAPSGPTRPSGADQPTGPSGPSAPAGPAAPRPLAPPSVPASPAAAVPVTSGGGR